MNTRLTIKVYLCLALGVHIVAVAVALYSVNASIEYWGHFLEGQPLPDLYLFVIATSLKLRWLSSIVLLAGIFAVFKASESWAMHCLACIIAITVGILCVTAVGLSLPMSMAAKALDRQQARHSVFHWGPYGIPAKFSFITTSTTLQEVIDRLGKCDRVRGSGISRYEYDLPDGSAVLISLEWPFTPTNRITGVTFFQSTNDITLYP